MRFSNYDLEPILYCKICSASLRMDVCANPNCGKYSVVIVNNAIESETLCEGNCYLCYLPDYNIGIISIRNDKTTNSNFDKLKRFEMTELSHESAVLWLEKLKIYSLLD